MILYLALTGLLLAPPLIYISYLIYGFYSAAPFVPTPAKRVSDMLALARIQAGERVFDIGSGDGRLVFAAAARGADAVGIEINPILYGWSVLKAKLRGLPRVKAGRPRALFRRENFWQTNLAPADVLTVYCLPGKMDRLREKIKQEMRPGARVVVYEFPFPGWPYAQKNGKVYLYKL